VNGMLSGVQLAWLWVSLFAAGLITYSLRFVFILLFGRLEVPGWLKRSLRFIPPAVLTAIIFPEIFISNGNIAINLGNTRLLPGIVAILVAWRTKNTILTIIIGMVTMWIYQAIMAR